MQLAEIQSNKTMSSREIIWLNTEKANDLLEDPYQVVVVWRGFLDTGRYSEGYWYVLNAVGKDEYEWQDVDDVTHFAIANNPSEHCCTESDKNYEAEQAKKERELREEDELFEVELSRLSWSWGAMPKAGV
jgi:hypothetical protein